MSMEKGKAVRCVPAELFRGLQDLSRRLWEEKNPAAVRLGALMEEFGDEAASMEKVLGEYEAVCSARLAAAGREHAGKEAHLRARIDELRERAAALEAGREDPPGSTTEFSGDLCRSRPPVQVSAPSGPLIREENGETLVFGLLISVLASALGVIGGYPYLVLSGAAAFALFAAVALLALAGRCFNPPRPGAADPGLDEKLERLCLEVEELRSMLRSLSGAGGNRSRRR